MKRSAGVPDVAVQTFDAVIHDGGGRIVVSNMGKVTDCELTSRDFYTGFRGLMNLRRGGTEVRPFGRTKSIGIITHEAMLPLANLVDVAIRVEGVGEFCDSRPHDMWLERGTTWQDIFRIATEEELDSDDAHDGRSPDEFDWDEEEDEEEDEEDDDWAGEEDVDGE